MIFLFTFAILTLTSHSPSHCLVFHDKASFIERELSYFNQGDSFPFGEHTLMFGHSSSQEQEHRKSVCVVVNLRAQIQLWTGGRSNLNLSWDIMSLRKGFEEKALQNLNMKSPSSFLSNWKTMRLIKELNLMLYTHFHSLSCSFSQTHTMQWQMHSMQKRRGTLLVIQPLFPFLHQIPAKVSSNRADLAVWAKRPQATP